MAHVNTDSYTQPIPEDTVHCTFFSLNSLSRLQWEQLCEEINKIIESLSVNYIWHRDAFKVYFPVFENKDKHNIPMHLCSTTCFADNIEDEWFIVYVVKHVTKLHKNIIAQIQDSDGEFLLIEAADFLPLWANSNTTENRVFIYNDKFHIIPPHIASLDRKVHITEALNYLQNYEDTKSSSEVENVISLRIEKFKNLDECLHTAVVKLPVDIAALLKLEPQHISTIVNVYCNNDEDLKFSETMNYDNLVDVHVTFTKFLYAMLLQSRQKKCFDKIIRNYNLVSDKRTSLGLKITCGYEIIRRTSNDIYSSKGYNKFIQNLKNNGYFNDNIEGSKDYQRLLKNAKDYFSNNECSLSSAASYNIEKSITSPEFIKVREVLKNSDVLNLSDDSDEWMTIHLDELNKTLNSCYGKKNKYPNKSEMLTKDLSSFLNKSSYFEGVETEYISSNNIEFEPDEFQTCIERFLGLMSTNTDLTDDSEFDEEEYISDNDNVTEDIQDEIKSQLCNNEINLLSKTETILQNFLQSVKEEKAASGPSSNLLQTIGIKKTEILDSDDDEE